ncbi:MAG: hypothetical protein LBD89_07475 [Tannerellaceae bacterium]|jgi:hypothetical protein|nr:hypothetical protein [Tannerellaceae bacterium]
MKTKYKDWISRLMLATGFFLMLTVIVPHHHHEDGEVCIFMWDHDPDHDHDHENDTYQSCECNGHTLAFNSTLLHKHASDPNLFPPILIPLYTLFDYITPPLPFPPGKVFDAEKTLYAESLYSLWVSVAAGFRAPPVC